MEKKKKNKQTKEYTTRERKRGAGGISDVSLAMPHPAAYLLLPPLLLSVALALTEAAELRGLEHNAETPSRKGRREETTTAPAGNNNML